MFDKVAVYIANIKSAYEKDVKELSIVIYFFLILFKYCLRK